jgi:hypothetical protein
MESGINEAAVAYFETICYQISGKNKGNQLQSAKKSVIWVPLG